MPVDRGLGNSPSKLSDPSTDAGLKPYRYDPFVQSKGKISPAIRCLSLGATLVLACSCTGMAQHGAVIGAYKSYDKGDYVTALRKLSNAESYDHELTDAEKAEILYLRGRCLEGMGNYSEALSLYDHLAQKFPDNSYAAQARGRITELKKKS